MQLRRRRIAKKETRQDLKFGSFLQKERLQRGSGRYFEKTSVFEVRRALRANKFKFHLPPVSASVY